MKANTPEKKAQAQKYTASCVSVHVCVCRERKLYIGVCILHIYMCRYT